jgi:hypothetical protein
LYLPPQPPHFIEVVADARHGFHQFRSEAKTPLRAGGKRTWIVQYRIGSKQRRVSLRTVDALDIVKARQAARDTLATMQLRGDRQTEKSETRAQASIALGVVARRYLDAYPIDRWA